MEEQCVKSKYFIKNIMKCFQSIVYINNAKETISSCGQFVCNSISVQIMFLQFTNTVKTKVPRVNRKHFCTCIGVCITIRTLNFNHSCGPVQSTG